MNDLSTVKINQTDVAVKEYHGKRVVTFKDIDQCHSRPDGTAGRNFRENKQHMILGTDYFNVKLTSDEIRRAWGVGDRVSSVIAITESGYLMLVKSFTDDLAWQVQRQLVNTYVLQQANKTIAAAYVGKTKMAESDALAMMDKESWLTAQQAVDKGLIDKVMFADVQLAAAYGNSMLPKSVIEKIRNQIKNPQDENQADFLQAKLNLLKVKVN